MNEQTSSLLRHTQHLEGVVDTQAAEQRAFEAATAQHDAQLQQLRASVQLLQVTRACTLRPRATCG